MQDLINFIWELLPTKMQQLIMSIGSTAGFLVGYFFNGISSAFYWLCLFVLVDYITGLIQALHNKNISSKIGFKGIVKKIVILSLVILFHGMAETANFPPLETAAIFAFLLNEMYSILENIERAGLGGVIPPGIRQLLAIVETKEKETIDKLK